MDTLLKERIINDFANYFAKHFSDEEYNRIYKEFYRKFIKEIDIVFDEMKKRYKGAFSYKLENRTYIHEALEGSGTEYSTLAETIAYRKGYNDCRRQHEKTIELIDKIIIRSIDDAFSLEHN